MTTADLDQPRLPLEGGGALAFTGVTEPPLEAAGMVEQFLRDRGPEFNTFITGAAYGIDTLACEMAYDLYPHARHVIVVPAAPHNEDLVAWANLQVQPTIQIVRMPERTAHRSTRYMVRNTEMVARADALAAFPPNETEELRSGTWSTVRRAWRKGIPVIITPVGGS